MKKIITPFIIAILMVYTGCTDLDVPPKDLSVADAVFAEPSNYRAFLAKLYAGLAVSGQQGPSGQADIEGIDEGFSQYLRGYWKLQELSTDEAVTAWGDVGIADLHEHNWSSDNPFAVAFYARIFFQVGLANEYLRESTPEKLSERGITGEVADEIFASRADARFLRALSYWHGLDLYRNVPFFTEESGIGSSPPPQGTPQQVFEYIESELLEIESQLPPPRTNEYARADQAAAWTLLAKLYLNAEVYIGENRYTDCITYCNKILNSGAYFLAPEYDHNFLTDNHTSPEIIFPVAFDGLGTRSFGGMTFLTHMPVGGSMDAEAFGIAGGWAGMRTTSSLVDLFPDLSGTADSRSGLFWTDGQNVEIVNINEFTDGIGIVKYRNVSSTGSPGSNAEHPDTDFPMFRLADVHLMYAEAVLRGGAGDVATALDLINELRDRANAANISAGELTLDFILDERARELYWECYRRTDLVRFNQFSENGIWPWKGGVAQGRVTERTRDIFALPANEVSANPNLEQNDGY